MSSPASLRSPTHTLTRRLKLTPRRCFLTATPFRTIHVGILLKRSPIILRDQTPFETAYYAYRQALDRAEARPFYPDFYFRKGTTVEKRWIEAQEAAKREMEGEVDKLLVQPREVELAQVEMASRVSKADEAGDLKSLDRALQRTLYLVVKGKGDQFWSFPAGALNEEEDLETGPQRILVSKVGENTETWFVGHRPVGHFKDVKQSTFFMKAHIMSGRIELADSNLQDHAWCTKQELESRLSPEYYVSVKGMLSEL